MRTSRTRTSLSSADKIPSILVKRGKGSGSNPFGVNLQMPITKLFRRNGQDDAPADLYGKFN